MVQWFGLASVFVLSSGNAGVTSPRALQDPREPAWLIGRCVAAESGEPLAGCTVKLRGRPATSERIATSAPVEWTDPEPVLSGKDGSFLLSFVPPAPYQFHLEVSAPGRAPRTARWSEEALTRMVDLGDVALCVGRAVHGVVRDTRGKPVEGLLLSVTNLPLPLAAEMAANDRRSVRTDEQGRFAFSTALPLGNWPFQVELGSYTVQSPERFSVADEDCEIEVVVRGLAALRGRVVDQDGVGMEGLRVRIESSSDRLGFSSTTRADGSFEIAGSGTLPATVRAFTEGGRRLADQYARAESDWGAFDRDGVEIVVDRSTCKVGPRTRTPLELEVVAADTGAAVEEFCVQCCYEGACWSDETGPRLGGVHEGGRLAVDRIHRGRNRLRVLPLDPSLLPSDWVEFDVVEEPLPQVVALTRGVPVHVLLHDSSGKWVQGSKLDLLELRGMPVSLDDWFEDPRDPAHSLGEAPCPLRVSSGTTDRGGEATLFAAPASKDLVLRVQGRGHVPLLFDEVRLGGVQDLTVVRLGSISGKLEGAAGLGYPATVSLDRGNAGPLANADPSLACELGPDGGFSFPSLAPGRYRLVLGATTNYRFPGGLPSQTLLEVATLEVFDLEEGEDLQRRIPSDALRAGSLEATVRFDGVLAAGQPFALAIRQDVGDGSRRMSLLGPFVADEAGRVQVPSLFPGTYSLLRSDPTEPRSNRWPSSEPFEIRPGETSKLEIALVPAPADGGR